MSATGTLKNREQIRKGNMENTLNAAFWKAIAVVRAVSYKPLTRQMHLKCLVQYRSQLSLKMIRLFITDCNGNMKEDMG